MKATNDLSYETISALMTLQGFVANEIAKHEAVNDLYASQHWKNYCEKIANLEDAHYRTLDNKREQKIKEGIGALDLSDLDESHYISKETIKNKDENGHNNNAQQN